MIRLQDVGKLVEVGRRQDLPVIRPDRQQRGEIGRRVVAEIRFPGAQDVNPARPAVTAVAVQKKKRTLQKGRPVGAVVAATAGSGSAGFEQDREARENGCRDTQDREPRGIVSQKPLMSLPRW